jgi:hypothetical protein
VASQRCTNLLSLEDAAYIAGLIDGEGTITLTRIHSNENRRLVVSIDSSWISCLIGLARARSRGRERHQNATHPHSVIT